ncbi:MAG: hypothetical protein A3K11_09800 [Nitrospirae bacterium RIFCSPLOWO2_12_FULL_63_8]|nr:MAG: hypothetical protein A3K11_09800 [Nitrospirae bacterium RIFCSPLOWO2_12_FULL_63_8]
MTTFHHNEQGATLIELMLAMVIASMIVAAGFTVLYATDQATRTNDQIVDTQQNARMAMELIARDVRAAGFGMGGQVGGCVTNGIPAPIVPLDNNPAGPDTGPDAISLVVPVTSTAAPGWSLANPVGPGFSQITLHAGAVAEMMSAGFSIATLPTAQISINGAMTETVSAVSGDTLTFARTVSAPASFPAGTKVYLLQCVTYTVGTTPVQCDNSAPCLLRNGTPMVDGIEDFQVAYGCDGCNVAVNGGVPDGIVDDQDSSGAFDAADFITNSTWSSPPFIPSTIRLIRIAVVARQRSTDRGISEGHAPMSVSFGPVVVSDHDPSGDAGYNAATYSQFRRRGLSRTVDVRNLAF